MFSSLKKSDKGFTLVELMVVVLIIGILVAIAIPIFNNASKQAKIKTCDANVRTINGSVSQYAATEDLVLPTGAPSIADLVDGDYLKSTPECPFDDPYALNADGFYDTHDHSAE